MTKHKCLYPLIAALALTFTSCREFEGLDRIEQNVTVDLQFDQTATLPSVAVIAPGVDPIPVTVKSPGLFSFVRPANTSKVPAWRCIIPARTDVRCDGLTATILANLPSVQYPTETAPDKFSMLAITPAFNLGIPVDSQKASLKVDTPDSLVLPFIIRLTGLASGTRIHSVDLAADSLALTGSYYYDFKTGSSIVHTSPQSNSLSLHFSDGLPVASDGTIDLQSVIYKDIIQYAGAAKLFISSADTLFSISTDSLSLKNAKLTVNLQRANKAAGKSFCFNNANIYNTLKQYASATVIASDGTSCTLEMSKSGLVGADNCGNKFLCIPAGEHFTVPSIPGKEVSGILIQLTGASSDSAKFNVFQSDSLIHTFSASTTGRNGGLTALSVADFPVESDIYNLSGMRIVPVNETSRIAGFVITVLDYVDPHKWEDGHIDDEFNNLFNIL